MTVARKVRSGLHTVRWYLGDCHDTLGVQITGAGVMFLQTSSCLMCEIALEII